MKKRMLSLALALFLVISMIPAAQAKTTPGSETVNTALFYITNDKGEDILVSHMPISGMDADMKAGKIGNAVHNYSMLDRYVTPVHQEAQGFTVGEFIAYAQSKSDVGALRNIKLTFDGIDKIRFWEIDQAGYDDLDTYTYNDLYGVARYNFPLLYQYWNYTTQDYYDPSGEMPRAAVIDHIFSSGQSEVFLLSVTAFSQRYILTEEKYGTGDYNLENYWNSQGLLDNERSVRLMKPMTKDELYNKTPTASDTRYWVANIRLDMAAPPSVNSLGAVAAPAATMTEDANNYYIRFSCATDGATILYNQNYQSPSYSPTFPYGGGAVVAPKSYFPDGKVTMTAHAADSMKWAVGAGLINGTTDTTIAPQGTATRAQVAALVMRLADRIK